MCGGGVYGSGAGQERRECLAEVVANNAAAGCGNGGVSRGQKRAAEEEPVEGFQREVLQQLRNRPLREPRGWQRRKGSSEQAGGGRVPRKRRNNLGGARPPLSQRRVLGLITAMAIAMAPKALGGNARAVQSRRLGWRTIASSGLRALRSVATRRAVANSLLRTFTCSVWARGQYSRRV